MVRKILQLNIKSILWINQMHYGLQQMYTVGIFSLMTRLHSPNALLSKDKQKQNVGH